jgi:AcrR family transcriptional regulator
MTNKKLHGLSDAEIEKRLLAKRLETGRTGLTITEVAKALGCSKRTVHRNKEHLLGIMLNVGGQAIDFVKRLGYEYVVSNY